MDIWAVLSLAIRWLHAVTAAIWVGGGIVYFALVTPRSTSLGNIAREALASAYGRKFRRMVRGAIGVFILTGTFMTFQKLAEPGVSAAYATVLALKIALSFVAFGLVWRHGAFLAGWEGRPLQRALDVLGTSRGGLAAIIGLVVYLLALVLRAMAEASLAA